MEKREHSKAQMPLQVGPLGMRLSSERDPHLRELSDQEGVKQGLALMAFSLDRLWEAVAIELGTHDERRIARGVKRLLVKFGRADGRWGKLKSPK